MIGVDQQIIAATEAIASGESVYLHGLPGSGKTHLAVSLMAIHYSVHGIPKEYHFSDDAILKQKFLPAVEFFLDLKQTYGDREAGSESDYLDGLLRYELLILDDIGAERVTDWSRQMLYTLIDRLYRGKKQFIVTSNLPLAQLSAATDDRIASRIAGSCVIVDMGTKDWRIK